MIKYFKTHLNFYDLLDVFMNVSNILPFFLLLVIPYLFDQVNGYSVILCLPLAFLYVVFSSKKIITYCINYEKKNT
jgi:hypothetical protein